MNENRLEQEIETVRRRLKVLEDRRAGAPPPERDGPLSEALEHLSAGLEDLQAAATAILERNRAIACAHRAAEAERTRYSNLFESAPDGCIVTDPSGTVREANRAAANLLGLSRERLRGMPLLRFVHPNDRDVLRTCLQRVHAADQPLVCGVRMQPEGHIPFHTSAAVAAVRDGGGALLDLYWTVRDATDRVLMEECLERSNACNRGLVEAGPDPLAVIDRKGSIIDVNAAVEAVTGYPREDLIGTDFADRFTEPDSARAGYRQALRDGRVRDCPLEVRHRDGSAVPVLCSAVAFRDAAGEILGAVATARTVAERRATGETVTSSEDLYRTIVENTGTAIMIVEEDGTVAFANVEFEERFGYPRSDLEGTIFWEKLQGVEHPAPMEIYHRMRRLDAAHTPRSYEAQLIDAQGGVRTVLITAALIPGTMRSVLSLQDITEQKRAEEALRESEEKFRGITQRSFDMIYTCYHGEGIAYISPAVERILGYRPEEMIGGKGSDYVLPASLPAWQAAYERIKRGEQVEGLRIEFRRRDGTAAVVELNKSPIVRAGRVVGVQGVGRDVTEREQIAKLRQQACDQIGRNIEQFAILGDHIRQPLRVIMGMAELIDDPRADEIVRQVRRINEIVRQLDRGWVESRKIREFLGRHEQRIAGGRSRAGP